MPKKEKTAPSAAMKALDAAKEKHDAAKAANEKQDNATTKAALKAAKDVLTAANTAVASERWKSVGAGRVGKVVVSLGALKKCANPRSYEWTPEDIVKMNTALDAAVSEVKTAFENAKKSGAVAATGPVFTFG